MSESPAAPTEKPVDQMSFEDALQELDMIVSKLERGEVKLAESVAIYERGAELKARCDSLLKQAEARVEKIRLGPDGKPQGVEPLDGG